MNYSDNCAEVTPLFIFLASKRLVYLEWSYFCSGVILYSYLIFQNYKTLQEKHKNKILSMIDDFACHSVQSGLSQNMQISDGRCVSVVLSTIFGIHAPLVLKAFTTFIVTIMLRGIAFFCSMASKCKVFNQRNIMSQQGNITCAGCF